MSEPVLYAVEGGIGIITLNRPDALNAWTFEMGVEYLRVLDEAAADREAKVLIVTGAGRGFCAGADMGSLKQLIAGSSRRRKAFVTTSPPSPPYRSRSSRRSTVRASVSGWPVPSTATSDSCNAGPSCPRRSPAVASRLKTGSPG